MDHIFLESTASIEQIDKLCNEALDHQFRAVCIPPLFVKRARSILNEKVKTATVVGFPLGYSAIESKLAETVLAIVDGADEIDMMVNLAALKNCDWQYMAKEINTILPVVKSKGRTIKVILEVGLLNDEEIRTCCDIYGAAGVDMIKTSTGFARSTTAEQVKLLRKYLADAIQINAGPVNSYAAAQEMLNAGANLLNSANSVQIVNESSTGK